tara:strand:+ start:2843 stop:5752 length:2910 start_codon:yes stop_codon:yes gene_type:complete
MPLITSAIPNLINGVSQQPPALRLASQAEEVVNCMSSPVEGLKKRPPLNNVARLFIENKSTVRPFVHMVSRTNDINYIVIIQDGAIKVANLDGTLVTPSTPDGVSYLDVTGHPSQEFRVASIADYTFIVNREKEVAMSSDLSPTTITDPTSMVFIKVANYDTEYSVTLGGVTKTYTTPPAGGEQIECSYSQAANSSSVLVNATAHGLVTGDKFKITFSTASGGVAGTYEVTSASANQFYYTAGVQNDSSNNSGNCTVVPQEKLSTVTIADELADQLDTISGYTVNNDDYIIHIKKDDGSDYTLTSKDDKTGEGTKVIKGVVDDLDDLPIKGYEGFIVKVQGSQATRYDDYYVKFTINKDYATLGEFGDGVWRETVAPGITYRFDEATMPHVLVRNSDGSFTFQKYIKGETTATYAQSGTTVTVTKADHGLESGTLLFVRPSSGAGTSGVFSIRATAANTFTYTAGQSQTTSGNVTYGTTWSGRITGDKKTALEPTFVGNTINNLNLFRNRLIMLSNENVILSASDDYGRFWPETVQTMVDSDPVDLSCGGSSINILLSTVAFANTLLLFSRNSQFRLDAGLNVGSALTPKTATITQMTSFDMDTSVDPIAVGRNTYFPIPKGNFSGLREFFLPDSSGSVPLSEDVTSSIPRYIPTNLCSLISAVAEDAVAMLSLDQPKRIYIYKFFFEEDTKLQSAWSYWEVSGAKKIIGAAIKGSDLYVLTEYDEDGNSSQSGTYLEKVSLRPEQVDPGTEIEILLDRKITETEVTSTSLNNAGALGVETVITLPYPINTGADMIVVGRYEAGNTLLRHGQVIEPLSQTSNTITVLGDLKTVVGGKTPRFFVGERYTMTYEFSTPYIKEQPQGGGVALAAGPKLQMRTWTVIFDESSAFELKVTPASRNTNTYPYNGVIVGEAPPLIGDPSVLTGSFRVPVMTSNIDTKIVISSASPLPCRFQSAEWEGFYHTRAKRQ